jgi:hypothetical protein
MNKSILMMLVLIIVTQCTISAQEEQKNFYRKKIVTYSKMKTAGTTLTAGGILLTAIGISVFVNNINNTNDNYSNYYDDSADKALVGMLLAELGIGLAAGGATLWAIGGSKKAKYRRKLNALSLNLNGRLDSKLSLVYRF